MASSNPAFNRIEQDARNGYAGFRGGAGATSGAGQQMSAQQLQDMYDSPSALRSGTGRGVTMDDVIMKTLALFAIVLVTGAIGWGFAAANPGIGFALWAGGGILMLVLGLVIAFKKTLSVPLILAYAAVEGVFVGAISQFYAGRFDPVGVDVVSFQGIVPQAVLATVATFAGMLIAYKTGLIKVTARFRKIMTMMLIGYALFAVVNFIFAIVTNTPFGIGGSSLLGVGISVFAVGLAAFTLALDFDAIDRAIATGAPQQYSWLLAHGLVVTLVWLYLEFLRLLARLRQ